jgi:hypothetical protein
MAVTHFGKLSTNTWNMSRSQVAKVTVVPPPFRSESPDPGARSLSCSGRPRCSAGDADMLRLT